MNCECGDNTLPKLTFSNYIGLCKPYNSVIFINRDLLKNEQEDATKIATSNAQFNETNKKTEKVAEPKNNDRVKDHMNHEVVEETIKFAKTIAPIILNSPKSKHKSNPGRKRNKDSNVTFKDYNDFCDLKPNSNRRNFNRICDEKSNNIREKPKTCEIGTQYEENVDDPKNRERKAVKKSVEETVKGLKENYDHSSVQPLEEEIEDDTLYELNSSSYRSDGSHFMKGDSKLIKGKHLKPESENNSMKVKRFELVEMLGSVLKTEENDTEIKFTIMNHQEKKEFADEISSLIVQAMHLQAQGANNSTVTELTTHNKAQQITNSKVFDFPGRFSETEQTSHRFQEPNKLHKNLREEISYKEIPVKSARLKIDSCKKKSPHYDRNLKPVSNIHQIENKEKDMGNEMIDDQILDYFQTLHDNNSDDVYVENIDDQDYPNQKDVSGTNQLLYKENNVYQVETNTQHCTSEQQIKQQECRMQGQNYRIPMRSNCWSQEYNK